jgi:hypothetical protein
MPDSSHVLATLPWYLLQFTLWLLVFLPTLAFGCWALPRLRARGRCSPVLVLLLAAGVALVIAPVPMPLGLMVLPHAAVVLAGIAGHLGSTRPRLGMHLFELLQHPGMSVTVTFFVACALLWWYLKCQPR